MAVLYQKKKPDILLIKANCKKIFQVVVFFRIIAITRIQIFCKSLLYSHVIYESIIKADQHFQGRLKGMNRLTPKTHKFQNKFDLYTKN